MHLHGAEGGAQQLEVLGVRVAGHHQRRAGAGGDQFGHTVAGGAQADRLAHRQETRQARQQRAGGDMRHAAGCYCFRSCQRRYVKRFKHIGCQHPARLGAHAVQQHALAGARQQQRQQGREHGQLARAVVAGQHDHGAVAGGQQRQALVRGVQEPAHLLGRLALDAHGQAEGANFQVGHAAVQHLAKQVRGLLTRERLGAARTSADFLDVLTDAHGVSWRDL